MAKTLISGLFLAFVFLAPVVAQEPAGNPDAPTPKTGQVAISLPTKPATTPLAAKSAPEPDTLKGLQELASELLKFAAAAKCRKKGCTILVTDFVLPDGNTSPYGMRLADEFSKELASRGNRIHVIDFSLLHDLLTRDRITAKFINEGLARSIAIELKATLVVLGTTTRANDGAVQLSTRLLELAGKDWSGYSAVVNLPAPNSILDLSPTEPPAPLPPITSTVSGEKIHRSGVDGVSPPKCHYMPNPPYTERARESKLSGTVLAEAVINSEGKLENVRIVQGLPGGLNEMTIATMKTWQCNPAQKNGKPVPFLVYFEVTFRLY